MLQCPAQRSIEDLLFDLRPTLKRDTIAHLGTGVFLASARNVVLFVPSGTGKTHLAIGLGIKAAHADRRSCRPSRVVRDRN
ncbi:ATP-binding protein [Luethyella okanaganae]|uniref:ATP-binding protein n=1 Tax=Luethyella okanaganae TaxID=69372 RepID=A0ABW1VCY4_9MICO